VNSLPKTVTRKCRCCDLNPGPSAPESSSYCRMSMSGNHSGPKMILFVQHMHQCVGVRQEVR